MVARMSRGPHKFKQRDLTRAIRAAAAAGVPFSSVKIATDGSIVVMMGEPAPATPAHDAPKANSWDRVLSS
jgi:hypothetical protein